MSVAVELVKNNSFDFYQFNCHKRYFQDLWLNTHIEKSECKLYFYYMLVFLLLLLPLAFIFYCFVKKDYQIIIPAVIGLMSAVIFCAFKSFLTFSHRVVPYSFSQNFIFFLSKQLIPVLVLCAAFFVVSRDSFEYRFKSFFSLVCPFEIVYMPYFVISLTESTVYSNFGIFIYPLMVLSMLIVMSLDINYLYDGFTQRKIPVILLNIPLLLIYMILPSVVTAAYFMGTAFHIILIVSGIYIVLPLIYYSYLLVRK